MSVSQPPSSSPSRSDMNALKVTIHRNLIQKINLDRMQLMDREMVRREGRVLPAVLGRRQSDHAGARSLCEQTYERRMIRVRVGAILGRTSR